jgi:predicted ATPase/DNA-binding SARP family transcriptional activator
MQTQWRIELLGRLAAVRADGTVAQFPTRSAEALLAFLAYHREYPHPRGALIELLWPEVHPESGRSSLRVTLYALRRQLEQREPPAAEQVLWADRNTVSLNPRTFTTDVIEFEAAVQAAARAPDPHGRARHLRAAVERYRGVLLPGYHENWLPTARQHLAELYQRALHDLVLALEQTGAPEAALEYAQRAVAADPLREEAHYALMRLYAAAGLPSATLRQYQELERVLRDELGETPSAAARELVEELRESARTTAVTRTGRPAEAAPPPAEPAPSPISPPEGAAPVEELRTTAPAPQLPPQFSRFFGREEEIARVCAAISRRRSAVTGHDPALAGGRELTPGGPRLVTLTGPGGCGKTRLAIAAAGRLQEEFAGGAARSGGPWFVPLAELTDARRLYEAVRNAMALPTALGGEPIEQIAAALQAAPALLILDNFEQLVQEGAPLVRRLLERVPSLTCLVTSRQRLELEGEQEIPVPPLPVPVASGQWSVASPTKSKTSPSLPELTTDHWPLTTGLTTLAACPSVQLFVDRAQTALPEFCLTGENAGAVAELCRQLEGLPLAIELAAARAAVLTPQQMLSRLAGTREAGGRFDLLVSPRRDVSTRHRTLRATLEWSYRLLPPALQQFFARLSIFRGGWTLAAAETICSDAAIAPAAFLWGGHLILDREPDPIRPEVLSCLEQLRQSSLVLVEVDAGEMRYRLLESVREFAAEQLTPEDQIALARRHFHYFLPLVDVRLYHPGGHHLSAEQQKRWLQTLDREYANLRAALEWGLEAEPGPALFMAAGLAPYWLIRGSWAEAVAFLPRAAVYPRGGRADELLEMASKALLYAGEMAHEVGEYERGREWLAEAVELGRMMGSPRILAAARVFEGRPAGEETEVDRLRKMGAVEYEVAALHNLGHLALDQGDLHQAGELFQRCVEIRGELWAEHPHSVTLAGLGWVAQAQGEYPAARACYEKSLALSRQTEHWRHVAQRLGDLGFLACQEREYEAARQYFEESLGIFQGFGDRMRIGLTLTGLGDAALGRGDAAAAAGHYRESLARFRELGHRKGVALALEGLAQLARTQGSDSHAVSLLASAHAVRHSIGFPLPPNEQPQQEALVADLRHALGEAAFTSAWEEGRRLPWEQAASRASAA